MSVLESRWRTTVTSSARMMSLFLAVSVARAAQPGARFDAPIAIENIRIVPGVGEAIDEGTILIERGRITAVGRAMSIPSHAERIDGGGLVAYPGFIDAHTHAGVTVAEPTDEQRRLFEDEAPDVRDGPRSAMVDAYRRLVHPHWRTETLIDPASSKLSDLRRAGFTAAMLSPPAAILAGHGAIIQLGDRPMRRQILDPEFAQHAAFIRGGFRRGGSSGYPSTTMGALALFRQTMLDARWQQDLRTWGVRRPSETPRVPHDRDLEAVDRILSKELPVVFQANRENEIHRALNAAAEFGLRPIISGGREAWRTIDRLRAESVPLIVSLKYGDEPKKVKPPKTPATRPAEDGPTKPLFGKAWQKRPFEPKAAFDERQRLWEEEVDNCIRLHEAGVEFALGSFEHDSPGDLLENLRRVIKRGLPEEVAVAALTRHPAALLGLSDRLGTIEPGKLANLTILTGPLSDKKSVVRWVFIDGQRHEYNLEGKREEKKDKDKDDDEPEADEENEPDTEEQADTRPAEPETSKTIETQPAEAAGYPEWPIEIEADRHPDFKTNGNVVLENATVLTITGGTLKNTDVVIANGKITAIGRNQAAPPGAVIVDLTGYVVSPGLIDAHSHMAISGGLNEGTLSVTPEVRAADVVNHRDSSMYRALAGGITTIHTMHGSANSIGGQNVILKMRYGKSAEELEFEGTHRTVKWALGENVTQKHSRTRGTRFPNSRMGVTAVHRRSLDAAGKYAEDWRAYREAKQRGEDPRPLRRDLRLEALADVLAGDIWVHCHCYRADEVLQLLHTAEDYGFRIAVLQHILEGYRLVPEIARHGCGASTFPDWWAYKLEAYDAIPHNAARMVQGGIAATVNSDSGEVVRHMNVEAAKSIAAGALDETAALRLVTLNAAIQLGIQDRVGSVEVGKDADLAIFDGHPLDTFSKCVLTLVDGEAYFVHPEFDPANPPTARHGVMTFDPIDGPAPAPPLAADTYLLVGGTVHPVSGPPIENATVIIRDGKIVEITTDRPDIPDETSVVRVAGLHVYPGLIDAATSLGMTEVGRMTESVDTSEIGRFQPDLRSHRAINPHSELINVTRIAGTTTTLVIPGGGVITGRADLINLDGWTASEMLVGVDPFLVVNLPSLPPNLPDKSRGRRINEHVETIRQIERYFQRARHYADLRDAGDLDARDKPPYDSRWDAMRPYVRRERPVLFNAQSYKQILEVLMFAERVGVRPIINGGRDAWKLADRLAEDEVPVILHGSTTYPERPFGTSDSNYKAASILDGAGVRFCIATNSASNARQLGVEAGMAVAHGLDPDRAVHAVTLGAAEVLGIDDRLGSIEPGKRANLIVTNGHPCQASTRVLYEFINGEPVPLESRHTRWDDKFRNRPDPKLPPAPRLRGPEPMRSGSG